MAAKFRAIRGECGGSLGMGFNRDISAPLVQSALIFSDIEPVNVRSAASRSALPFKMKGGYIGSGSQRRLVIVGKIGKF